MQKNLTTLFLNAKYIADENMEKAVWQCLIRRQKKQNTMKLWIFSGFGILSLTALVPMLSILFRDFAQSGFYDYVSLLFSGGGVFSYSKELFLSIVESLPIVSITLSLGLIFFFFLSLRYTTKHIVSNQLSF